MNKDARERILGRVREANRDREPVSHPGPLPETAEPPWASGDADGANPIDGLENRFRAAGGEVVRVPDRTAAGAWLSNFSQDFPSVTVGETVPADLQPQLPRSDPAQTPHAVLMALGDVAATGSPPPKLPNSPGCPTPFKSYSGFGRPG